jgi:hypothetical protein
MLLHSCNTLIASPEAEDSGYRLASIIPQLIDVFNTSQVWQHRSRAELGHNGMPYRAVISQVHNPADNKYPSKLFPFDLEFESLDSAITTSFTWSVQLQILNKIIRIHHWMNNCASSLSNLQHIFAEQDSQTVSVHKSHYIRPDNICTSIVKAEADRVARHLCQFFGYCQRIEMGTVGPQCCRYPTWVLKRFFRQNAGYERELEWVSNVKPMTGPGFHLKLNLMEFADNP